LIKLRQILLVAALLFAQLVAGAHAVEHVAGKEKGLPTHVCELCLAAHDLGEGLPGHAMLPVVAQAHPPMESTSVDGRSVFPAPQARQGAPPRF
jgi:hypothetical protein